MIRVIRSLRWADVADGLLFVFCFFAAPLAMWVFWS
jgi:hypothetical protein